MRNKESPIAECRTLQLYIMSRSSTHQGKLMGHPSIRRQLGSKAQRGEHLVAVVVLNDLADRLQGHGVGVQLVWAHVVERGGLGWVSCEMQKKFRDCERIFYDPSVL